MKELIRVTKPFKLASREMHPADTVITLPQTKIGPGTFTMIAGPCSVEDESMILRTAEFLMENGIRLLRAGAFKPRTSPYSFQGMGLEGLDILRRVREKTGIGIVTGRQVGSRVTGSSSTNWVWRGSPPWQSVQWACATSRFPSGSRSMSP